MRSAGQPAATTGELVNFEELAKCFSVLKRDMSRQLCRLCEGRSDQIKIFDDEDFEKLPEKILFCLNITVLPSDSKQTLCSFCKTKVTEFYEFKRKCQDIETKQIGSTNTVRIKSEPVERVDSEADSTSKLTPSVAPYIYPWVPLGEPILLSDLPASLFNINVKQEKDVDCKITSPAGGKTIQLDVTPPILKIKEENLDELQRDIDAIINQVETESEKSDSSEAGSSKKNESPKNNNSSEKIESPKKNNSPAKYRSPVKSKSPEKSNSPEKSKSPEKNESPARSKEISPDTDDKMSSVHKSSDDDSSSSNKLSTSSRGGRGRKRRGGSVRGMVSKRGRPLRSCVSPKTPANEVKRLTRSSTGTCTRRRVIDSSDSDGDFHDPDDPDDPEFTSNPKRDVSPPSSSSSSSSDEEEKEQVDNKKRIIKKTDLSLLLASAKQEKEDSLKKQCPHCRMVYKHWISYDDHVKSCKGKEKESKEKTPPEDDEKERKCVICLSIFKGTRALREHMEVHQPKKVPNHHCKTCNESFTSKGGLICHNALKHRAGVSEPIVAPERKKHHCVQCNETFDSSGDFICHTVLKHKKK